MNLFLRRYRSMLGQDVSFVKIKKSLRINTCKISPDKLISRLASEGVKLKKIDYLKYGYHIEKTPFSLGAAPEYLLGYYYLQESASQIPVQVLNPLSGVVLDMSAAPGGKTTQISQFMKNKGAVVALEPQLHRIKALQNNLERCGASNVIVYNMDGCNVKKLKIKFDKVLLDAPCSGNFIMDKNWFSKKTIAGINERAVLQKKLLSAAVSVLKKGGVLVYSTCSLEPEENEEVIDYALKNLPVRIEDTGITIGDEGIQNFNYNYDSSVRLCRRLWPDKTETQPFFISKLRRL